MREFQAAFATCLSFCARLLTFPSLQVCQNFSIRYSRTQALQTSLTVAFSQAQSFVFIQRNELISFLMPVPAICCQTACCIVI